MLLHYFNPDNDMALASGAPGYTPPASIRRMMQATALLPARWASPGDGILTPDGVWVVETPAPRAEQWSEQVNPGKGHFIPLSDALPHVTEVRPWGWSPAARHRLRSWGVPDDLLPTDAQISRMRWLSSRERAVELLPQLVSLHPGLQGESSFCTTDADVLVSLTRWPSSILKAPWSGSGKGIRYSKGGREDTLSGWYQRIIKAQGGVVVEPLYDKLHDVAMEFYSDGQGRVTYQGLSVFTTHANGAYAGNSLWPEEQKMQWLTQFVPPQLVTLVRQSLESHLGTLIADAYRGPLGVDMMVLSDGTLHPCVEINLRMTMGYVALLC